MLARYYGAHKIILLGYDCDTGKDGIRHWHGKHRDGLKDAESLPKFASQFARAKRYIFPIEVVNASRHTLLDVWPRVKLEDALND